MLNVDTLRILMRGPLLAIAGVPPILYENRAGSPPDPTAYDSLFVEEGVTILDETRSAQRLIETLGETRYEVYAPINTGTADVDLLAKKIADAYEAGLSLAGSGITVGIFKTRRLPGARRDPEANSSGAWFSVPVIVTWRAFTPTTLT